MHCQKYLELEKNHIIENIEKLQATENGSVGQM